MPCRISRPKPLMLFKRRRARLWRALKVRFRTRSSPKRDPTEKTHKPKQRCAIFGLAIVAIILALAISHLALAQTVNVNTASESELAGVKGIGKKLAAKIVANRPYTSVADLSKAGVS